MRMVLAAALIEGNGILGNIESAAAEALLDVDENVGEVAAAGYNVFGCVCAFAGGGPAHIKFCGLGGFGNELHGAAHASCSGGDGCCCRAPPGHGGPPRALFVCVSACV